MLQNVAEWTQRALQGQGRLKNILNTSWVEEHCGKCYILHRKAFTKISQQCQCCQANSRSSNNSVGIFLRRSKDKGSVLYRYYRELNARAQILKGKDPFETKKLMEPKIPDNLGMQHQSPGLMSSFLPTDFQKHRVSAGRIAVYSACFPFYSLTMQLGTNSKQQGWRIPPVHLKHV